MRYLITAIFFLMVTLLQAKEVYPEIFSTQGTPLYSELKSFALVDKTLSVKPKVDAYMLRVKETQKLGFKADKSKDKEDIKNYFKSLRSLQSTHDKIISLSIKALYEAIKKDDYEEFKKLIEFGISSFEKKPRVREKILFYYQKNRKITKIKSLERMLRYDKNVMKQYDDSEYQFSKTLQQQNIILLTSKGCGWCKKTKALLRSTGRSYKELDIKSSQGARLYKKYNGSGVPILITNTKVVRGYNRSAILDAIQ